ncbi:2-amino-3-ketobutyrate coenzyme A ligase [Parvularcula lutaonensis]|nr:glycine C-acetyltransferase [Parvularcula lutaonensis]GGY55607.1 2-amino-3-ketobutyrate coenzyme A ligase [Parvularcula lutaonensis]
MRQHVAHPMLANCARLGHKAAMTDAFYARIRDTLQEIDDEGLTKPERLITSKQGPEVTLSHEGREIRVLNFCANNYLGLAAHPDLIAAAQAGAAEHGYGMASVRFICGTQEIHRKLEREIAEWLGFEDSITFAACFDANGAVFEPLLGKEDAIISDSLNHASIIDGVRLCKAQRFRYDNNDMASLEEQLKAADAAGARTKLIVTDGVFSMDGYIAQLGRICELAEQYGALVMVDDCHATGFMGDGGRGTHEHCGVMGKVDIITGTLGKALGGGMGGFICARQEVVDLLRQRARPYLFSNALAPALVEGARKALQLVREGDDLRKRLFANARLFRSLMTEAGFDLLEGEHPIIPVMLYDAKKAQTMAARLLDEGVFVTGFSFPVVPRGQARIRTQMNAAHTEEQVREAVAAFTKVGKELGVI